MRVTLTDASLARYAGRFVWLDLNFDGAQNKAFLARYGVTNTPSFYVLDPTDEHAAATQLGAMTAPELTSFLERGEHNVIAKARTPSEVLLARGDALLASEQHGEAATAYESAIRAGGKEWPDHDRAVASFTWALMSSKQSERCAQTAAEQAPRMQRTASFGRLLVAGLWCVNDDPTARWAQAAAKTLEPLAAEAIDLPSTALDHRFQLYQGLMSLAKERGDKVTLNRWGDRWLKQLDTTRPVNDDERSALDIARVDAASLLDDPSRVLPALIASERAMPTNYNASLRLAQMQLAAKHYSDAIAACDRGLEHVNGALGRSWLLQTKADALMQTGHRAEAQYVLAEALHSARQIAAQQAREHNIARIEKSLKKAEGANKSSSASR